MDFDIYDWIYWTDFMSLKRKKTSRKNQFHKKLTTDCVAFPKNVGFPKNRTVNNSNLLTLNSNCHNEKQQI
mgnify:CR=1 FL=1